MRFISEVKNQNIKDYLFDIDTIKASEREMKQQLSFKMKLMRTTLSARQMMTPTGTRMKVTQRNDEETNLTKSDQEEYRSGAELLLYILT
jgi:hypothetical protein